MTLNVTALESDSNGTVVADNSSQLTLTATVISSDGGNVNQASVTWEITNGSEPNAGTGVISPLKSNTDTNGKATAVLTASTAGSIVIHAYTDDDSASGGKTLTVNATEVSADSNVIHDCTSELGLINCGEDNLIPTVITAIVWDASNTAVSGVDVTWTVDNGTLDKNTSTTNDKGEARVSVTADLSELGLVNVTAKTEGDDIGKTVTITAMPSTHRPVRVTNATEEDGYVLNQYDIGQGVSAEVLQYGAGSGDMVTLFWGKYSEQFIVNNVDTDIPHTFNISDAIYADALAGGEHWVFYQVNDSGDNLTLSSPLKITVEEGGETQPSLPKPQVPAAASDSMINIVDVLNGVVVNVTYEGMVEGDLITLYWKGFDGSDDQLISNASTTKSATVANGETTVIIPLENNWFYPFGGEGYEGSVEAFYTVKPANGEALALSQTLKVFVDTVPSVLS